MSRAREWWDRQSSHRKALAVAATGTGLVLGTMAILPGGRRRLGLGQRSPWRAPKLRCGEGRDHGMLFGPDVSKWQGEIDWNSLCDAGISFAFIKATQDTHIVDARFKTHWEEARRIGVYRGAYHFAVPKNPASKFTSQHNPKGGPIEQAEHFYATVGKLSRDMDLPPVLDMEWRATKSAETAEWCREFLVRTENLFGRIPAVYTTTNFIKNAMGNPPWIKRYMFWQAYWTNASTPPSSIDGLPWTWWQFTNKARIKGIKGGVDMNRFFGTSEDLAAVARGTVLPFREKQSMA